MPSQNILIVGAMGKQGGAVIQALVDLPEPPRKFRILALTRSPKSKHAKALVKTHRGLVKLVQGDRSDPEPIFSSMRKGSIAGLFVATTPRGRIPEEQQAIPLIDAAVDNGVKHIVFMSVDRGGDDKSWTNPTTIKHFLAKHNIELHLRDKARREAGRFTWTILRPAVFLDNMNPGIACSLFTAMWAAALKPETKLRLVGVRDVGVFAAMALSDPAKWSGRAVGLAGDGLTLAEAREKFAEATGKTLPRTWTILGRAVLWAVKDVGNMFTFFEEEGHGVDLDACRREAPMQDFETWLRKDSKWLNK